MRELSVMSLVNKYLYSQLKYYTFEHCIVGQVNQESVIPNLQIYEDIYSIVNKRFLKLKKLNCTRLGKIMSQVLILNYITTFVIIICTFNIESTIIFISTKTRQKC